MLCRWTSYDNLDVGKYQLKAMSGHDCGEQLDCLQSDGSGYFIVPGVNHADVYAFSYTWLGDNRRTEDMTAYKPMMNGFAWLLGRAITDTPGCPCPEGGRRKPLFGSMLESTCCAIF